MQFTYGAHAMENLHARELDRAWVERTVVDPDSVEGDPKHSDRVRAYRTVPERDGRVMRVVYVPTSDGAHIITMFLDRRRRRTT